MVRFVNLSPDDDHGESPKLAVLLLTPSDTWGVNRPEPIR
jgi:hypothetical protein